MSTPILTPMQMQMQMLTQMPMLTHGRKAIIAVTIACVCLTVMPACDDCQTKSSTLEHRKRQYQRALIVEFCMPGTFYMECIWHREERCHLEMPMAVVYCIEPPIRPGQTHREAVLECVLRAHFGYAVDQDELPDKCVDPTRWKHIPPTGVGTLKTIHESWLEERNDRETSQDADNPGDKPGPDNPPDNQNDGE